MPDLFTSLLNAVEITPINLNDFLLGAASMLALRRQRITTILDRYLPGNFERGGSEEKDSDSL